MKIFIRFLPLVFFSFIFSLGCSSAPVKKAKDFKKPTLSKNPAKESSSQEADVREDSQKNEAENSSEEKEETANSEIQKIDGPNESDKSESKPFSSHTANPSDKMSRLQESVSEMVSRLEDLETKLKAVSLKLDATRTLLDNVSGVSLMKSPKKALTKGHSAEHGGQRIVNPQAKNDPEFGFANDDASDSYRRAAVLFKADQFPEAILAFSKFVEEFPDHPLAGSAQFFIGESYFRQNEYKLSIQEFQRVLTSYDRSAYLTDTLKRMAEAEEKVNRSQEASKHRQLLSSLFPHSPAAATSSQKLSQKHSEKNSQKNSQKNSMMSSAPTLDAPPNSQVDSTKGESHQTEDHNSEEAVSRTGTTSMSLPPTAPSGIIQNPQSLPNSPNPKFHNPSEMHSAIEEVKVNEKVPSSKSE